MEHPSEFASTLRKDPIISSLSSLRRDSLSPIGIPIGVGSWSSQRRDSLGSTGSLRRDSLVPPITGRRNSYSRRFSTDSLDSRRNSWDPSRRGSSGSSGGWDDPIWEDKKVYIFLT